MVLGRSVFSLMGTCLRLRMMSVASSTTPGIDENSCRTPSIFTAVMAAPSIELNSARRNAFPTVVPQPRSNGCAEKRPYFSVNDSSSDARRFGFWKPFHILFLSFRLALCGLAGRRFWIGGAELLIAWKPGTDLKIGHYIFGFAGPKPGAYIYRRAGLR